MNTDPSNTENTNDSEESELSRNIALVDERTQEVAALLPFPVTLDADMGGTWALYICLGQRGAHPNDPHDIAIVDPDPDNGDLEWFFDVDGGCETVMSEYSIHSDPADVAAWITEQARHFNSPAVRSPQEQ